MNHKQKYIIIEQDPYNPDPTPSANVSLLGGEPEYDEIEEEGLDNETRNIVLAAKQLSQYLAVASKGSGGLWDEYANSDITKPNAFTDASGNQDKYYPKFLTDSLKGLFGSFDNPNTLHTATLRKIQTDILNTIKQNTEDKNEDAYNNFSDNLVEVLRNLKISLNNVVGRPKPYTLLNDFISSSSNAKSVADGIDLGLENILPKYKEYKDMVREKGKPSQDKIKRESYKNFIDYITRDTASRNLMVYLRTVRTKFGRFFTLKQFFVNTFAKKYVQVFEDGVEVTDDEKLEEFFQNFIKGKKTEQIIANIKDVITDMLLTYYRFIKYINSGKDLKAASVAVADMKKQSFDFKLGSLIKQFLQSPPRDKAINKFFADSPAPIKRPVSIEYKFRQYPILEEPFIKQLPTILNSLGDEKKVAQFVTTYLNVFRYDEKSVNPPNATNEGKIIKNEIIIDLEKIKENKLNESYIRMYKNWVKEILNYFLSGVNIPVVVKGSKGDVKAFAKAFGSEAKYLKSIQKYGLDNEKTYSIKSKLDKAIGGFEKETGLKWPFV